MVWTSDAGWRPLEGRGLVQRTICNYYTSLATFLAYCGVDHKTLLPQGERPRPNDPDPEAYDETKVERFMAALGNDRDRLFFEFLLKTGCREREATTLEWADITWDDEPVVGFHNKPELGFRTNLGVHNSCVQKQRYCGLKVTMVLACVTEERTFRD